MFGKINLELLVLELLKNKFSIYFCFMGTVDGSSFVNPHYRIFQQLYYFPSSKNLSQNFKTNHS
ncbi:hypothetical protein FF021_03490 [Leptospira noguchii]|nr:hypothetical protein FF021_03490 [Leptospira noguchii]